MASLYVMLPAFLLVLFRVGGMMLAAPIFSSSILPPQFKALLTVAISLAVFPVAAAHVSVPVSLASAVGGLVGELAIGLLIGLGLTVVVSGVQIAGQVVSQQAGLALGDVFNPMLESSVTVVSEIYFVVAMLIFLAAGGDHALIRCVLDSFTSLPPLAWRATEGWASLLVDLMTLSFTIAIRVGGPTMLALLLAFLTLGFISRTLPQLNLLTVGFPVKSALAILVMAMSLIALEPVLLDSLQICMDGVRGALGLRAF